MRLKKNVHSIELSKLKQWLRKRKERSDQSGSFLLNEYYRIPYSPF